MSTGQAIAKACLCAASVAFGVNEIRMDLNTQKKIKVRREKRKMMQGRSKDEQCRAIMDEVWEED